MADSYHAKRARVAMLAVEKVFLFMRLKHNNKLDSLPFRNYMCEIVTDLALFAFNVDEGIAGVGSTCAGNIKSCCYRRRSRNYPEKEKSRSQVREPALDPPLFFLPQKWLDLLNFLSYSSLFQTNDVSFHFR